MYIRGAIDHSALQKILRQQGLNKEVDSKQKSLELTYLVTIKALYNICTFHRKERRPRDDHKTSLLNKVDLRKNN